MVGLHQTPTHVISRWENPHGCFSPEVPTIGTEFMVWELLFGVAKGDGILLLPSSSGSIPPSAVSLVSHHYGPVSCAGIPGDFPTLLLHGDPTVLVDVP